MKIYKVWLLNLYWYINLFQNVTLFSLYKINEYDKLLFKLQEFYQMHSLDNNPNKLNTAREYKKNNSNLLQILPINCDLKDRVTIA